MIRMELIAGLGDYIISDREDDIIRTFALASCVAVTAYNPVKKVAGMIHVVLPTPFDSNDRKERPGYFAETGIPLLINVMCTKYGCRKEELYIQMYGGADSIMHNDVYHVGRRNINAVKNKLYELGLIIQKAELRGNESRTLTMEVKTGLVRVCRQAIIL